MKFSKLFAGIFALFCMAFAVSCENEEAGSIYEFEFEVCAEDGSALPDSYTFEYQEELKCLLKMKCVTGVEVDAPEGWQVNVSIPTRSVAVTAPSVVDTDAATEGKIIFTAKSTKDEVKTVELAVVLNVPALPENAWPISTAEDFIAFADAVNNGEDFSEYEIILQKDIDLSSSDKALFVTEPFTYNFNGNDHTITLAIDTDEEFSAIFKRVEAPGTIRNLKIAGSVKNSFYNAKVAALTCYSKGGVYENITTSATISQTADGEESSGKFGSLVSDEEGNGIYRNCHNTGNLTVCSARYVGGLIGSIWDKTSGLMQDCSNSGNLHGDFSETIDMNRGLYGGVVGTTICSDWDFIRCSNTGDITYSLATGEIRALGGFTSTAFGYFEDCFNTGDITNTVGQNAVKSTKRIGGFAGATWDESIDDQPVICHMKGCYNTGDISDICNYIGGFMGIVEGGQETAYHQFENCYNSGNVTVLSNNSVADRFGGFIGTVYNVAYLKGCSNSGKVVGYTRRCAGGLIGGAADYVVIENCENTGDVYAGAVDGDFSKAYSPVVGGLCGVQGNGSVVKFVNSKNTGKVTAMVPWETSVGSVYACEATANAQHDPAGTYEDKVECDEATKTASASAVVTWMSKEKWTTTVPEGWL